MDMNRLTEKLREAVSAASQRRGMQGARSLATARTVIQGIEATQMIRKGLGIPQHNRRGQAWVFGALLGLN